jgi:hypothetical protein
MMQSYELALGLVADRQRRLLGEARAHRLVRTREPAPRAATSDIAQVHHLPVRLASVTDHDTRAAG